MATVNNPIDRTLWYTALTDETASRSLATEYQNTSGVPMLVMVSFNASTSAQTAIASVGAASGALSAVLRCTSGGAYDDKCLFFIVPVSWYYQVDFTAPGTVISWFEAVD